MDFVVNFFEMFILVFYLVSPLIVFLNIIIILMGQVVGYIEKWTKFDSLYWTYITATTVGYGDIRPIKKISRILSVLITLVGMIFTGIVVAIALHTTSVTVEKYIDDGLVEKYEKVIHGE